MGPNCLCRAAFRSSNRSWSRWEGVLADHSRVSGPSSGTRRGRTRLLSFGPPGASPERTAGTCSSPCSWWSISSHCSSRPQPATPDDDRVLTRTRPPRPSRSATPTRQCWPSASRGQARIGRWRRSGTALGRCRCSPGPEPTAWHGRRSRRRTETGASRTGRPYPGSICLLAWKLQAPMPYEHPSRSARPLADTSSWPHPLAAACLIPCADAVVDRRLCSAIVDEVAPSRIERDQRGP